MSARTRSATAAVMLGLVFASCTRSPAPLYPVHGKVTYKGEPAVGASLSFQPKGVGDLAAVNAGITPTATVGEDGAFSVDSGDYGPGAPVGEYKVLITWRNGQAPGAGKKGRAGSKGKPAISLMTPDRLGGRFSNPARPRVTAEVKPGPNELPPIDLAD
jgi:hypothetical protein